jgi:ABC-type transport system substrate-binding protein
MRRPQFEDRAVRIGLAHAFDWDEYLRTKANGLGVRVTSTWFVRSPTYDHSIAPIPYDLDMAAELFEDAGWYDRDGDDNRDKDGVPFEFTFLTTPGNSMALGIAVKLQENLARVQVRMNIDTRDWATFQEQTRRKDFDTFAKAWVLDVENDPYQLWHSWEGDPAEDRGSNYPGLADERIDELIRAYQLEVDDDARREIGNRLQQRIYELQPYMFAFTVPTKFAVAKRVRNFKSYGLNPGYSVRDWYVVED